MKSFKPDFCFVVLNGDALPDQKVLQSLKPTGLIKTPTGRYIFFQDRPYNLSECQELTDLLGGVQGIRRIFDYSQPKEQKVQGLMWERRSQPSIRLSSIVAVSTVEQNNFQVYFNKHYLTLTFRSRSAAQDARLDLLRRINNESKDS